MSLLIDEADRRYLERLVARKSRPTKRQKAQILLGLANGEDVDVVAMRVGVPKPEVLNVASQYATHGLESTGLVRATRKDLPQQSLKDDSTIVKTPNVCGGRARIFNTRIPVWQLVEAKDLGASEAQLLNDFPVLTAQNLVDAWAYAIEHPEEITAAIHDNAVA
jgi:uncharacterized protein (DUF433 family)